LIANGILVALGVKHSLQLLRKSLTGTHTVTLNHAGAERGDLRMRRPNPRELDGEKNKGEGYRLYAFYQLALHV
jgi:hypothetical protein